MVHVGLAFKAYTCIINVELVLITHNVINVILVFKAYVIHVELVFIAHNYDACGTDLFITCFRKIIKY